MKNIIKVIAIAIVVVIAILTVREYCARYTMRYCEVYDIGKYEGEIAIIDNKDDIWVWREEIPEGLEIGDECRLKMHTNFTDWTIDDDYIIDIIWVD